MPQHEPKERKEKSIRKPVTIEEVEDEENLRKTPSLSEDISHILMEESEYQQYVETQKNPKSDKKSDPPKKKKPPQKKDEPSSSSKDDNIPQEFRGTNQRREYSQRKSTLDKETEILISAMAAAPEDAYVPPPEDAEEAELLAKLRAAWEDKAADILTGVPHKLPPFREINHKIPLMDDNKRYNYHLPRCADALKTQLLDKIKLYKEAGWWVEANVPQAAPILCITKKDGKKLRTALDARKRNDNTVKDVTPFPDQEQIRTEVARGKYRSKIDMSNAYEQIRVDPEDVWKTAFATVYGTFLSNTMQIGDCNAPATFQRIMTAIFRDFIGRFVHVYLDDIFVYSNSKEEHEEHLKMVFDKLREWEFFLEKSKLDLYSKKLECLGHIINDNGIHADPDKMSQVRNWPVPKDKNDLQRFLGLVQYLAHFMPDVTAWTGPLAAIQGESGSFVWLPIHQTCMDNIKAMACKTPILKPIDPSNPDPIWVICDASVAGVGAVYGQGPEWQTCRPAGFMSKKFSAAQHNYRVFEMETIAILEALLKWEDKLIGNRIHVVTDHRALEFFKTQRRLSHRQMRWMEYLSRFDFDIRYVKGNSNTVADSLSRYHQLDNAVEKVPIYDFVNADHRLDPEGEDLPWSRVVEIRAMSTEAHRQLIEGKEDRSREAQEMTSAMPSVTDQSDEIMKHDPTVFESVSEGPNLARYIDKAKDFADKVAKGYESDPFFAKIMNKPQEYPAFELSNGLLYSKNRVGDRVLCIPRIKTKDYSLTATVIDQAHRVLGHFGPTRTAEYIRRWYWWPRLGQEVEKFCKTCGPCYTSKSSNKKPVGLLHPLPIPTRPWGSIGMDFVGPFPKSKGYDYLWVIICRLTSMVHLVPINTTTKASELAWIYVHNIVKIHGLPESIVSDRDSKFTSKFWMEVHRLLGTKLLMSTSFHPQTDGATERANRSVGQILRTMVKPDQTDWVERTPLVEFAINSSISASTGYAPFELNYGYMPTFHGDIIPTPGEPPGVKEFVEKAKGYLAEAHDSIIESRVGQAFQANKRRSSATPYEKGDKVYLSTENLSLPKGRAKKLVPKYIGPYTIIALKPEVSRYTLDLPTELKKRRIHPTFHENKLRPYVKNDETIFPRREAQAFYDFGEDDEQEWLVDEILTHQWKGNKLEFLVRWNLGDTTWEPYNECKELEALDRYLELQGIQGDDWKKLPRKTTSSVKRTTPKVSSKKRQ